MAEAAALTGRGGQWRATLARFSVASLSSALVSASHLLVQIVAIGHLAAREIGTLAFLLVIIQFGYSLSNALVSTPYAIAYNQPGTAGRDGQGRRAVVRADEGVEFFFPINLMLSLAQGAICAIAAGVMADGAAAAAFGAAGFLSLLRWFGRSTAYARHRPGEAARSDLCYAAAVGAGLGLMLLAGGFSLAMVGMLVAIAGLLALIPFGAAFLARHRPRRLGAAVRDYGPVWRRQSAWTLIGVATTEATSNAHSYIVTLIAGPAAFAPIAVAMLFFRPVNVCITALTQLERPRMARAVADGDGPRADGSARAFAAALIVMWLLTAVAAAALLMFLPQLLAKPGLSAATVALAVCLCAGLSLVQCLQTPLSVLVQARGAFRPLAATSARSCVVGIAAVIALTLLAAPVWSVAGVVTAQVVMLLGIVRLDRRLRAGAGAR